MPVPVPQPTVYLTILTTEMFDKGAQVKIREPPPEIQAMGKNKIPVDQFTDSQILTEDFICVFRESVQREK